MNSKNAPRDTRSATRFFNDFSYACKRLREALIVNGLEAGGVLVPKTALTVEVQSDAFELLCQGFEHSVALISGGIIDRRTPLRIYGVEVVNATWSKQQEPT